jgi:hypothetical protein
MQCISGKIHTLKETMGCRPKLDKKLRQGSAEDYKDVAMLTSHCIWRQRQLGWLGWANSKLPNEMFTKDYKHDGPSGEYASGRQTVIWPPAVRQSSQGTRRCSDSSALLGHISQA